ncbi:AraC family transcriptional regulator [Pseudomonas sp. ISL-88]|nr:MULTISPECIES: helix-turn-helix transcriptional regulator [unclassified Bacillus (in: firmicutes)]MBT2711481.1 AraC family transcriptional regulator [Pseudomonas sp. ISL-88]
MNDLSIKQIAEEVGLTIHYFTRVFKADGQLSRTVSLFI